jgi:hypothetical protein
MRWAALALLIGCGGSHAGAIDANDSLGSCDCGAGSDGSGSGSADAGTDAGSDGSTVCDTTPACPSGQWCVETVPVAATVRIASVWAIDSNDVFAVGDAGTILRRRCNAWTMIASPTTQDLRGVWANTTDVWAVGAAGAVVHYDGATWSNVAGVTTIEINGVWGSGSSDVWAVGGTKIFHWDGANWTNTPLGGTLLSVSGTGPMDVWTTGEGSNVRHYTGTWSGALQPLGSAAPDFQAVLARSATNVWVAAPTTTANYGGSSWTPHTDSSVGFQSFWGRADNDVWAAGQSKVGHWDGAGWTVSTPTGVTTQQLWGVTGTATDLWVVGDGATILHQD